MRVPNRIEMEDFKRLLNEEIEVYQTLEQCLDEKKQVIIRGDMDTLVAVDNQIERLTQQARDIEQKRLTLMVQMGREQETLREFINSLKHGEDTESLRHAREKLIRATEGIQRLSKTNHDLLTQSIRLIEQSVDFIASILSPEGPGYSHKRTLNKLTPENQHDPSLTQASTICRDV